MLYYYVNYIRQIFM